MYVFDSWFIFFFIFSFFILLPMLLNDVLLNYVFILLFIFSLLFPAALQNNFTLFDTYFLYIYIFCVAYYILVGFHSFGNYFLLFSSEISSCIVFFCFFFVHSCQVIFFSRSTFHFIFLYIFLLKFWVMQLVQYLF